jgi:uncharacterized protein
MNILPNSASFLVTENCNNACKYCFEKHNPDTMTPHTIRRGLDYLCENAIKTHQDHFHAMIFGGEPLLEPDLIDGLFEYGCMLGERYHKNFTASIVTNATIFNHRIRDIILKYKNRANLSVQLSVDGIQEVQDMYRVRKDGSGSFAYVEKNIPKWKEVFKDDPHRLSIHGCCNRKSLPYLHENYLFFRETWGIEKIWFLPIHSEIWEDEDVKIYEDELIKIKNSILSKVKEQGSTQEVKNYAPIDRCLKGDCAPSHPCGAGRSFVTITAKGDIWPCHHFYFNDLDKTLLIGNIWDGVDDMKRNIFLKYGNMDMSCAKEDPNCKVFHCYRCIADNWVMNGSILSQIRGPSCEMSKVEQKIQTEIKEEIIKMGLLNSTCTGQQQQGDCQCNLGQPPPLNQEDGDRLAEILKVILDKIQDLEQRHKRIEEKLDTLTNK